MALSTKKVTTDGGGSYVSKTIEPGNVTAKILEVRLEPFTFVENSYHIILELETKEIPGFEGFAINKDKPDGPKYKGQVGRVKMSQYAYVDGVTKTGREVSRDTEILRSIKTICEATDTTSWFNDQDEKHDTIESFVNALNAQKPFRGALINFCIGGKEYLSREGYTRYDLFLPRTGKGQVAMERNDVEEGSSRLMSFDANLHVTKKPGAKEVSSFSGGGDSDDLPPFDTGESFGSPAGDFEL